MKTIYSRLQLCRLQNVSLTHFTKCLCDHDIAQSCVRAVLMASGIFSLWFYGKRGTFIDKSWTHNTGGKQAEIQTVGQKNKLEFFFVINVYLFTLPSYKEVVKRSLRIYAAINHDNISAVTSENEARRIKPVP